MPMQLNVGIWGWDLGVEHGRRPPTVFCKLIRGRGLVASEDFRREAPRHREHRSFCFRQCRYVFDVHSWSTRTRVSCAIVPLQIKPHLLSRRSFIAPATSQATIIQTNSRTHPVVATNGKA